MTSAAVYSSAMTTHFCELLRVYRRMVEKATRKINENVFRNRIDLLLGK